MQKKNLSQYKIEKYMINLTLRLYPALLLRATFVPKYARSNLAV